MSSRFAVFQKKNWPQWMPDVVALIGLLAYLVQSIIFAHTTISNLDEGAYLLKGILFASGEYRPFDPGISTNKAPLAFLIPGYVQLIFGAGLRTGRYLAIFFGVIAVVGTWVVARRIGNRWLAAAAVWVFTCSPMIIKIYSGGATQSTIACLMAWMLAFSLGENRPNWQLLLSGLLAGLMMMVRQNMLPVLPLLVVYGFWQHERRAFWILIPGLTVLIAAHIIYWPDIFQLWTWIPLIPWSAEFVYSAGGVASWSPEIPIDSRFLSIFQAVRFHFAALVGGLISFLLWPKTENWKSRTDFRTAVFLFILFWGLTIMHSFAAIGKEYCVFCFTPYLAFFNVAGILLLVVSVKYWNWQPSIFKQLLLFTIFLIVFTGVGFSAFEDVGPSLLKLPSPRMRDFRILPGLVTIWDIVSNKFQVNYNVAMRSASALFGFVIYCTMILILFFIWRRLRAYSASFAVFFSAISLVVIILSSPFLHGSAAAKDCTTDVVTDNEEIGKHLRNIIPQQSSVYWDGGLSTAPLLYLPGIKIFPAQINGGYSFFSNGDTEELFRFGFWNEEMKDEWKATADFFIIEEKRYENWAGFFTPRQFDEFERTPIGTSCLKESRLRVFHRK